MQLQDFLQAKDRISPYLKPTPLFKSEKLQKRLDFKGSIYLKLDCEQPTGSFKVRGAFNVLLQLALEQNKVVAFSSGNFAQAVAYGSKELGKKATIVMPKNAPHKKIEGTKQFGADIVFSGERHEDGDAIVKDLAEKEGFTILHPFNNYHTIAGQGTVALEILAENDRFQHFFCPVGGGGLLSGAASVLKAKQPSIKTYGVEPSGANDFYLSFQEKKHIALEKTNTIADGLRAVSVGKLNYPILISTVDQALVISDEDIIHAMGLLWEEHQMVIEPSGAVGLAGFLSLQKNLEGDVVILITGKNVDEDAFKKWLKL
jgi:threonine dehydratase